MKAQAITKTYAVCPHCENVSSNPCDHVKKDKATYEWDCKECHKYYKVFVDADGDIATEKIDRVNNEKWQHIQYLLVHNETNDPKNNFFLMVDDNAFFGDPSKDYKEQVSHLLYRINSGTCPANWMGGRPFFGNDMDPHGIFRFVAMRESVTLSDLAGMFGGCAEPDEVMEDGDRDISVSDLSKLESFEVLQYFHVPTPNLVWPCPITTGEIEDELHYTDTSMTYLPGIFTSGMKDIEEEPLVLTAPEEAGNIHSGVPLITMGASEPTTYATPQATAEENVEFEDSRPMTATTNYSCECGALFEEEEVGETCPVCQHVCKEIEGTAPVFIEDLPITSAPAPDLGTPNPGDHVYDVSSDNIYIVGDPAVGEDGIVKAVIDEKPPELTNDGPAVEGAERGELVNLVDPTKLIHEQLMNAQPEEPKTLKVFLRPGVEVELRQPSRENIETLGKKMVEDNPNLLQRVNLGQLTGEHAHPESKKKTTRLAESLLLAEKYDPSNPPKIDLSRGGPPGPTPGIDWPLPDGRIQPMRAFGESEVRIPGSYQGIPKETPQVKTTELEVKVVNRRTVEIARAGEAIAAESAAKKGAAKTIDISRISPAMPMATPINLPSGVNLSDLGGFAGLVRVGNIGPDDEDNDFEQAEGSFNPMK